MQKKIKLFIIEDRDFIREALKNYLNEIQDMELVGEADNGLAAMQMLDTIDPDVILTDLSMPVMDGMETVNWLKSKKPNPRIIAMSINNNILNVVKMCSMGVTGFYTKDEGLGKLPDAIRQVANGWYYLSENIKYSVFSRDYIIRSYLLPSIADHRRNANKVKVY